MTETLTGLPGRPLANKTIITMDELEKFELDYLKGPVRRERERNLLEELEALKAKLET
jgi:hypothetical protein